MLASCQRPLTSLLADHSCPCLVRSLESNWIKAIGASALAAVLKETQITNLECAEAPSEVRFCVSAREHSVAA